MFLPIYLARDFGAWSFLVFAIPNVLGAAAVAFLVPSTEAVRSFAARHLEAIRAFAWATILFHIVFLSGFMPSGFLWLDVGIGAVAISTALMVGLSSRPRATRIAVGVWIGSIALALCANIFGAPHHRYSLPPDTGTFGIPSLIMAAPAIVLGFLLCPMLDGTFLATREFHGRSTKRIFLLAFGLFFPALILLTLGYAGTLIRHNAISWYTHGHLALQSGFTIGVQWWALRWVRQVRAESAPDPDAITTLWSGRILLAVVGLTFGAAMFAQNLGVSVPGGGTPRRFAYDLMLSLYGLTFPAYLAAIAAPRLLGRRGSVWVLLAVLGIAGPLYWVGSIDHRYWAIPVAVLVVLAAPVVSPRDREKNREIA